VPEWHFLPFCAILRAVPDKLGGVVLMFASILVWFAPPWLDTSKVRSMRFRPIARIFFFLWVASFAVLTYVGAKPAEEPYVLIGQIATAYYFAWFLVLLPLGKIERPLPLPDSISAAVLRPAARPAAPPVTAAG